MSSVKSERASTAAPHSGDSMDASSGLMSASSSSSSSSSSAAPAAAGPVGAPPGAIVLPGDTIALAPGARTRLGAGVWQKQNSVLATRAGQLRCDAANKVWVDCSQRRYTPVLEDNVVGVVREKQGEQFKIDIGASHIANLPFLAFEGATKRNRPNLEIGAVIYARVVLANKDMEPELSCISTQYKKEWMTGQAVFGEVNGGYMFECSTALCHQLLDDNCTVLRCLGRALPFELAIGVNGRVWVHSAGVTQTIVIANAILNSHQMPPHLVEMMVNKLVQRVSA